MTRDTFEECRRIDNEIRSYQHDIEELKKLKDGKIYRITTSGGSHGTIYVTIPREIGDDIIRQIQTYCESKVAQLEKQFERL